MNNKIVGREVFDWKRVLGSDKNLEKKLCDAADREKRDQI